ncbi:MAG: glycosyltransferase family 4 protein [Bacteroidales bacterium]|nr:glycosyltransferase family 4 protein [Bacteroidales bacterium]
MEATIAIINRYNTPAVRADEQILSNEFSTLVFNYRKLKNYFIIIEHFRLIIWLLFNRRKYKLIYSRFIVHHAFLVTLMGKLLSKKVIVVAAGKGIAAISELNYGYQLKRINRYLFNKTVDWTTSIIAVSEFAKKQVIKFARRDIQSKITIIPNGIDTNFFTPQSHNKRKRVITIAGCDNYNRFRLKGIDLYCKIAMHFPTYEFIAVGIHPNLKSLIKKNHPKNISLLPWCNKDELLDMLNTSSYICQLSLYETFGVGFAEGMACNCIPITFSDIGCSELVHNTGILIPMRDKDLIIRSFNTLFKHDSTSGTPPNQIIEQYFSVNSRKTALYPFIKQLINSN